MEKSMPRVPHWPIRLSGKRGDMDVDEMKSFASSVINVRETKVIGHVHIADAPGRHEPGTGEINYRNVMKHLEKLGCQGRIYEAREALPRGFGEMGTL